MQPSFDARFAALGLELPPVPTPIASFLPWRIEGNLVFLAGQICEWNGAVPYVGKVGVVHDLEAGIAAARVCGLNLLAALKAACGGTLDRVHQCVRVGGFVNCADTFPDVPLVVNGASDLFKEVFGDRGAHCRTAIGVAQLPRGAAVEVDAIFALR